MTQSERHPPKTRKTKRAWCYVQRPKDYEIAGCECGNNDPDWSEWKGMLWCARCKKDFVPKHSGIFDGPVAVNACELLGIYFDRIDLKINKLLPDFRGNRHYKPQPKRKRGTR